MCAGNPERARRFSRGEVTRRARGETRALRTRDDVGKKKPLRLPSCCVTKSWLVLVQEASPLCSFGNHQARERRDGETPGEWNTPGAPLRALWHVSILPSLSSPLSPPLIENLCARIDDEGTRTRGCVAGSGVTPRAVRPRRAHRVPSSRILRSVWVILGGAHRVLRSGEEQTDFREEKRTETTDTQLNSTHSTHSLTPLHSPRWLRRSEQSSSVFAR
jgi:hypothetical protein